MAAATINELRMCSSLLRQCCTSWKGLTQNNVVNSTCVISGMKKVRDCSECRLIVHEGGGYSRQFTIGVCHKGSQTLTLFKGRA